MNKCFLKELKKLKQELIDLELDKFINKYKNVDIFIGDSDAIEFIENILKNNLQN